MKPNSMLRNLMKREYVQKQKQEKRLADESSRIVEGGEIGGLPLPPPKARDSHMGPSRLSTEETD